MENKANILIVDDRKENLFALEALLEAPGLGIKKATSGNEALGLVLEHDFAVVLLDVQMPEMDGFEVAELMRKSEKTRYIPIIFMTAISKEDKYIFKGYETGAVDYLFKPIDPIILKTKINVFLELNRHRRELEKSKQQIEKQNEQLKELAVRDALTDLYNRRYFQEILNREFALAKRNKTDISCFMIDLDYFKEINDTYGHAFGDFVLRHFARLLGSGIRETDILARYGGEEFVLLLPHTGLEGARVLAEKFRQKAEAYVYEESGYSQRVTASIGIASYAAHHPPRAADLVIFADRALYRAKAEGRNQVRIYREEALVEPETGTLKPPTRDTRFTLKKRLREMLEKTGQDMLTSLESVVRDPHQARQGQSLNFNRESTNRTIEIIGLMGNRLGLPEPLVENFKRAAKLHDLFKVYLGDENVFPDNPEDKHDHDRVNPEDYPFMLDQLARLFNFFSSEWAILRYHREKYDGSGHPEGLQGKEVPVGSRLLTLADAFVSMTFDRENQPVLPPEKAVDELVNRSGQQFDPMLVDLLLDIIREKNLLKIPGKRIRAAKEKLKTVSREGL